MASIPSDPAAYALRQQAIRQSAFTINTHGGKLLARQIVATLPPTRAARTDLEDVNFVAANMVLRDQA